MIQGINASEERFLAALDRINAQFDSAQRQIDTGLRVSQVSDAPDQVSNILVARAQLDQTVQIEANLGRAKTETDTAEQALENAVQMVQRANQLGAQGATGTQPPAQRAAIGVEVGSILQELVEVAGTTCDGRYVFSGDSDQVAPYAIDASQPNGVSAYAGSPATRQIMDSSGTLFPISQTAQDIFDNAAPASNIFAAVHSLQAALTNGPAANDPNYQADYSAQTTAINAAMGNLATASDHLNAEVAFYGTVQDRIAQATNSASQFELGQRTELSSMQDADVAAAAVQLTQAQTEIQAAMEAQVKQPTTSLFNYLA